MVPTKAYILYIDNKLSIQYAEDAARSCEELGFPYELFRGYTEDDIKNPNHEKPWMKMANCKWQKEPQIRGKAGAASISHYLIWQKMIKNDECAIILEHDALLLRKVEIDIPDNTIVALGYKVYDPINYNHKALETHPQKLEVRKKHGGAHAYTLTPSTARTLLARVSEGGNTGFIDNSFFLGNRMRKEVALNIIDPICALGWLRQSTIWKDAAVDNHNPMLPSFMKHYKSDKNLGVKG